MADIHCQRCGEPWDTYHLRHDAIHETDLPEEERRTWNGILSPRVRTAFQEVGYEFGTSVYSVTHCPCCKPGMRLNEDHHEKVETIHGLLGDDLGEALAGATRSETGGIGVADRHVDLLLLLLGGLRAAGGGGCWGRWRAGTARGERHEQRHDQGKPRHTCSFSSDADVPRLRNRP